MLASCTLIQIGAALARGTFGTLGPLGALGWRFSLAAIVLVPLARPKIWTWAPARWRRVLCFGLAAAVMEFGLYEALARLPLGLAVTLEFLGPIAVALAGGRGRRQLICAVLALAGVVAICLTRLTVNWLGVAFALCAAVGWGSYIIASERVGRDDRPQDSLAIALVIAAVLTAPLAVSHAGALVTHNTVVISLLAVATLGTIFPFALEITALRRLKPSTAGVLFSIEPAIAALVGLIGLNQGLRLPQLLGLLLVVSAGANVLHDAQA